MRDMALVNVLLAPAYALLLIGAVMQLRCEVRALRDDLQVAQPKSKGVERQAGVLKAIAADMRTEANEPASQYPGAGVHEPFAGFGASLARLVPECVLQAAQEAGL